MTSPLDGLRVGIVGDREAADALQDQRTEADRAVRLRKLSPDPSLSDLTDTDCLLVDQESRPDAWVTTVEWLADRTSNTPVVVLVSSDLETTVAAAIEAGADDYLPRSLCRSQPGLVTTHLADLVRERAGAVDGGSREDSGTTSRNEVAERFRLITENVSEVIYIANADFTNIEYVNQAYEEIWGRPLAELYEDATAFIDGIDPRDRDEFVAAFEQMQADIENGDPAVSYENEFRVRRPDGEVRWVLVTGYPVETITGARKYVGFVEDVTERHELEQTYRELFENVSDGLVLHEPDTGDIRDVNERYCELTGYDREELVGSNLRLIVSEAAEDTYETAKERIEDARVDGPQLFEFEAERKDGEPWVGEVHLTTIEIRGEEQVLASVRDVTERTRRERAIRELQAATDRMQHAESAEEVADVAVETAVEALGLPLGVCWFHDEGTDQLEPLTATEAVHDEGLLSELGSERYEYEVFESGSVTTYTPNQVNPENPLETAILLPLADHGLIAAGQPEAVEYDAVTLDVARALADHTVTALDRIDRARELRESRHQLQAIVDRIDEAIFLAPMSELDEADPAPDYVSSGYEAIWGQPLEGLHETYEEGFFGSLHPEDYDGYRAFIDRIVADAEAGSSEDRYQREYRIERPDGEVRWVHSDFYPTKWRDDVTRVVIVSRDITERKQRQRAVESFHEATAELTTVDSSTAAAELSVQAAADILDMPATAVYAYEPERGVLEPTAAGPALPAADELDALTSDTPVAWETFVDETTRKLALTDEPALDVGTGTEALVVPLGGNGLLVVWDTDVVDTDVAGILAATLEAALNRLQAERELETRRAELEAQTERARRLEAITEVTQRVEAAITTASTRGGVYDSVCAELIKAEPFEWAWIGAAEVGTDQLTPRATAGVDRRDVEQVLGVEPPADADQHPAIEAWETGAPGVVNDLVGRSTRQGWREQLLKAGVGSVCAVPIDHGGVTYGVVAVTAGEPDAFDDRVMDVLAQLGTSIGYAMTAIERQRALESDETLELEFRGADADLPPARLARALECSVRHERTIRRQDGSVSVYYTLEIGDAETVAQCASDALTGEVKVVSSESNETVIERRGSSWFGSIASSHGGVLRRGVATKHGIELVVELPRESDARTIAERLIEEYPSLEVAAQRQHRESAASPLTLDDRVERRLSDRQYEALETAHTMGYFDWPRETSGEDVAETLDITQPTVNKHIRLGEQKVFSMLFGETGSE